MIVRSLVSLRAMVLKALALAFFVGLSSAHAAVWGFIDEQGRPHVATEKLDERYQLFFRGPTNADIAAARQRKEREAEIAAFAQTPVYQRLTAHPNAQRFDALIDRYAKANALDTALVKAVVAAESGYEPTAVSDKGALGLMQVIPDTAARYGVADDKRRTVAQKLFDPATNLRIGTRYLRDLLTLFDEDLDLALAAYNAGEATVQRYDKRIPPYPETQEYVKLVTQLYALYKPPPPTPASRVTIPRKHPDER
jgi:soluble lytic murein transglycosylase-like protein